MNKVILMGNLSTDVTVSMTKTNKTQVRFNVAVQSGYGDNKSTDFIPCIAWGKTAETISTYFSKGKKILVEGSVNIKNSKDNNGNWKTYANVVVDSFYFVESNKGGGQQMNAFGVAQQDNDNIQF